MKEKSHCHHRGSISVQKKSCLSTVLLQVLDYQTGFRAEDILFMEDELAEFKGGMTENYVACQLVSAGFHPYFWRNEKGTNEVDFIINLSGKLIPVEVKSGDNVSSVSLKEYVKLFAPAWSIRISEKNFGFENNIKSVPLYAAFCIRQQS